VLRREPRAVLAVLLAPLGAIGFYAYLWRWTGTSPLDWLAIERDGWQVYMDWGFSTLYWSEHILETGTLFYRSLGHPGPPLVWVPVTLLLAVLGLLLLIVDRAPAPPVLYTLGLVGLAFVTAGAYPSQARLLVPAFPALIPLVRRLPGRIVVTVWLVCLASMTALGVMEFVYLWPGDPAP
jgi:hypothetical protein